MPWRIGSCGTRARKRRSGFSNANYGNIPTLLGLRRLVEIQLERGQGAGYANLRALHCVSTQMLNSAARYRCVNCGFVAKALHWCCPSCQQWNTIKPMPDLVMKTSA